MPPIVSVVGKSKSGKTSLIEKLVRQINQPSVGCSTLDGIIRSIQLFRQEYEGKLALQMMFVEANKSYAPEMANIAEQLLPDEVQINTPLHPCAVPPLIPGDISAIRQAFSSLRGVVTVYKASRPDVVPLN